MRFILHEYCEWRWTQNTRQRLSNQKGTLHSTPTNQRTDSTIHHAAVNSSTTQPVITQENKAGICYSRALLFLWHSSKWNVLEMQYSNDDNNKMLLWLRIETKWSSSEFTQRRFFQVNVIICWKFKKKKKKRKKDGANVLIAIIRLWKVTSWFMGWIIHAQEMLSSLFFQGQRHREKWCLLIGFVCEQII